MTTLIQIIKKAAGGTRRNQIQKGLVYAEMIRTGSVTIRRTL